MSSKKKEEKIKVKFSIQPKEKVAVVLDESTEIIDFNVSELVADKTKEETYLPYQIEIKNLTDEKLYDVDLFNYDHDKQNKVSYSCTNGVPYERFLRFLSSLNEAKEEVKMLRFQVWCDYSKFISKQINCCVHTIYEKPNGSVSSVPLHAGNYFSSYQQQAGIIDIPLTDNHKIKLFNELQLRLSYLMPETNMIITIFPTKINE